MPDPTDPGTDLGQVDPGDPGTPTPTADDPRDAKIATLEQENHDLREARRVDRAAALGAKHGLSPTQVELLALVPADQMEDKATALAAERGTGTAPTPAPGGETPPGDPPAEPTVDPTLASFDSLPTGDPAAKAKAFQDELRERINGAQSLAEIEAIQNEFKQRQRAEAAGG